MANIFPRWTVWLPLQIVVCLVMTAAVVTAGAYYYLTPKYTRVGYQPTQPVAFSHAVHADQLGLDCRYCHSGVEVSAHSNVPPTATCMNCHAQVQKGNPKLDKVHESWATGEPIQWVRIHQAPDYVYFNHSVHVNRGVSCYSCHGDVNKMEVVYQHQSQSMSWCLDCHRNPEFSLRPKQEVYNLSWKAESWAHQVEQGQKLVKEWNVQPPQSCAACHR